MSQANRGKGWEAALDSQHELYTRWRLAYCQRNYPPVKVMGKTTTDRRGRCRFPATWDGVGPPDYTVVAADVTFIIEAKQCGSMTQKKPTARWAFSSLQVHQAQQFSQAERQGAVGLILLWYAPLRRCHAILWRDLEPRWRAWQTTSGRAAPGTASLSADDLDAISCWSSMCWDWLEGVLAAVKSAD